MPLQQCKNDNNSGWKWGDSGKCYTGPDGKKKAIKQGVAIEGPQKFSELVKSNTISINSEEYDYVDDALASYGFRLGDRIAYAIDLKRYISDD